MFVSGLDPDGRPIAGAAQAAAYNPATDMWRRIAPAPELRANAVWDGKEILLVGGTNAEGKPARVGYAYNPATNRWRQLAATKSGRAQAIAIWTGRRLLMFCGETTPNGLLAYNANRDRWTTLRNAPLAGRVAPTAVWTGHELVVWGGVIGTPAGTSTPPKYPADGATFSGSPSQRTHRGGQ
jgi:hypothetical protein